MGYQHFTNGERQDINRNALAVRVDDIESPDEDTGFFAPRRGVASYVSDEHLKALDETLESHGLKNLLCALQLLLEQRVEDGVMNSQGDLIHHLSRHNAYSRMAERIASLASDREIDSL